MSLCRAFQKRETESLSWSDIISEERPFSQYHSLRNVIASFSGRDQSDVGPKSVCDGQDAGAIRYGTLAEFRNEWLPKDVMKSGKGSMASLERSEVSQSSAVCFRHQTW